MKNIEIKIPLLCRPKKNSQQIIFNKTTHKPMIIQSTQYKDFERGCGFFLKKYTGMHIEHSINLCCIFYVPDRRKRDIVNLLNAIQDILVKFDVLADDNSSIVARLDGSRIIYDKGKEETIIQISDVEE